MTREVPRTSCAAFYLPITHCSPQPVFYFLSIPYRVLLQPVTRALLHDKGKAVFLSTWIAARLLLMLSVVKLSHKTYGDKYQWLKQSVFDNILYMYFILLQKLMQTNDNKTLEYASAFSKGIDSSAPLTYTVIVNEVQTQVSTSPPMYGLTYVWSSTPKSTYILKPNVTANWNHWKTTQKSDGCRNSRSASLVAPSGK